MSFTRSLSVALLAAVSSLSISVAQAVELKFFYPVAVSGPITKLIDDLSAQFTKENPDITVKPVYAGDYVQTVGKALTAVKGGDAPDMAILQASDILTMTDEDAVIAYEDMIKTDAEKAWLKSFFPAFMENSRHAGKTYGIPFQRSTPVLYWNKDLFKDAGLDPEHGPANWDEMRDFAKRLTKKDAAGNVTQWGIQIPTEGNAAWLFTGLTTANDVRLVNAEGNKVNFDDRRTIESLAYLVNLSRVDGAMPTGLTSWGATPTGFLEKKFGMIWTTTGNLTNIRAKATFPFGVAMLPAKAHPGAPTGGGNFYIFKAISPERQAASLKFVEWMTTPERAAAWSIATGYVATSPAAYQTEAMKAYLAGFPQAAVARDQLPYAVSEVTVHDGQHVTKVLNDGIAAAVTGAKTPEQAMKDAQIEATKILKDYQ